MLALRKHAVDTASQHTPHGEQITMRNFEEGGPTGVGQQVKAPALTVRPTQTMGKPDFSSAKSENSLAVKTAAHYNDSVSEQSTAIAFSPLDSADLVEGETIKPLRRADPASIVVLKPLGAPIASLRDAANIAIGEKPEDVADSLARGSEAYIKAASSQETGYRTRTVVGLGGRALIPFDALRGDALPPAAFPPAGSDGTPGSTRPASSASADGQRKKK